MKLKIRISAFLTLIFLALNVTSAFALSINARGGFLLNVTTGEALFYKNPDVRYSLASMTKLMAVHVIMDKVKEGNLSLDTKILISKNAHNYSRVGSISNIALNGGTYYTVDELLDSILVASACGSVVALAEHICGSEWAFVGLMNEKVKELSLNASFSNSTGTDGSNVISPRSMAVLAGSLVTNHPEILSKTSQKTMTFRGGRYNSTNKLLGGSLGVDGLKTGTSSSAGACFTATAERDGTRLVSVVMGSSDRFGDTSSMISYGYSVSYETGEQGEGVGTEVSLSADIEENGGNEGIRVIYNNNEIPFYDIDPIKIDGCVYVPIRVISSALSAKIEWVDDGIAEITRENTKLTLETGKSEMIKNNDIISVNAAPFVMDHYLLVPVRAISEGFDAKVSWDETESCVIISDK